MRARRQRPARGPRLDPLVRARTQLLEMGLAEARIGDLGAKVEAEVQAAIRFAEESPEPDKSILESTTYAGPFAG